MSDSVSALLSTLTDPLSPQDVPPSPEPDPHYSALHLAEPTLAEIMCAIKDCKASLTTQMETIYIDLSLLKQDVQTLCERTGAAEESISSIEDTLYPLFATVRVAKDEMESLKAKLNDL